VRTRAPVEDGFSARYVTSIDKFDLTDLNYLAMYHASAQDRLRIIRAGIKASLAKQIVYDLDMPVALTCEALHIPTSTISRKSKTDAFLRSDEAERILGLMRLVGQMESMAQGMEDIEGFDARAWTSRWLREPVPALGGATPLDYMSTMEGQALVSDILARSESGAYG
jgi:putative toxin-antitoxin system antitoxin component (TIGR02293 family)